MKISIHLTSEDIKAVLKNHIQALGIEGLCEFTYEPSPVWIEIEEGPTALVDSSNIFTWVGRRVRTENYESSSEKAHEFIRGMRAIPY